MRGHRVIGSPDYRLDETWLRQIGELMYARGGFDPGARQGASFLASGDRRAALAGLHIPTLVLHGQADQLMRPEGGRAIAAAIPDPTLIVLPGMATTCHKPCGPPSSTTSDPSPTDLVRQQANERASARGHSRRDEPRRHPVHNATAEAEHAGSPPTCVNYVTEP